jgi:intracellular multiplication protein IcmV
MGIWSGTKKTAGVMLNFRVDQWLGVENLKDGAKAITQSAKTLFTVQKATHTETFEEALVRLNITEADLEQRKVEFSRLMLIYLGVTVLLIAYAIYLALATASIGASIVTVLLSMYSSINAFRFHFWLFQIKKRKLGCTIHEWLNG